MVKGVLLILALVDFGKELRRRAGIFLAKSGKFLAYVDALKGAFRLVDLQSRKHRELTDVRINCKYGFLIRAVMQFVPQNTVELL